jgi:hypothetical protein
MILSGIIYTIEAGVNSGNIPALALVQKFVARISGSSVVKLNSVIGVITVKLKTKDKFGLGLRS